MTFVFVRHGCCYGAKDPPLPSGRGAAVPHMKVRGKMKNIKLEKALLSNKDKPIDMNCSRDMTYYPVGELNDMFACEIGNIMWRIVPFDERTWKKVSPAIKDTIKQHLGTKFDFDRMSQDPQTAMLT
ncbi:hypothetical protein Lser_V15G27726 [Lactuca serriola]